MDDYGLGVSDCFGGWRREWSRLLSLPSRVEGLVVLLGRMVGGGCSLGVRVTLTEVEVASSAWSRGSGCTRDGGTVGGGASGGCKRGCQGR